MGAQQRPYVVLSCCLSLDGYLDDATDRRLTLSSAADLDRVDEVRAGCDAILVGAGTVRSDDPALVVRGEQRRRGRTARGLPSTPAKVTVTRGGDLDPGSRFFRTGETRKIVVCATPAVSRTRRLLGDLACVLDGGPDPTMADVTRILAERGVRRLMVEGGGCVLTQFLTAGLADELQVVMAPVFVGDSSAPRFVADGAFPWNAERRAPLAEVRRLGDSVLLRYALSG